MPLLNNEGDPIENSTLFVHIAITNRRGGGVSYKVFILLLEKFFNFYIRDIKIKFWKQ